MGQQVGVPVDRFGPGCGDWERVEVPLPHLRQWRGKLPHPLQHRAGEKMSIKKSFWLFKILCDGAGDFFVKKLLKFFLVSN